MRKNPIKGMKKILSLFLIALLIFAGGCAAIDEIVEIVLPQDNLEGIGEDKLQDGTGDEILQDDKIDKEGAYTSKEDVALYLNTYRKLPKNFITKREASELGWESSKANLWEVTDKKSIGGDKFGNREGRLPKASGRQYYECDIDYDGGYRGAKRIVYSDDGLIYYTEDHYDSFRLLYGDE
nr:ribonuclease domain-containing protein [Tissierella sp.]